MQNTQQEMQVIINQSPLDQQQNQQPQAILTHQQSQEQLLGGNSNQHSQQILQPQLSPQRKPEDRMQNNLNQQLNNLTEQNIRRYHFFVKILSMAIVLFSTIFCQYLCLIQNVCYPTDIDIPGSLASSIVILLIITLIFISIAYFAVINMIKSIVWRIKYLIGLYFFVLVALMLYAFISISKINTSSKQSTWDGLSDISKQYYHNKISDLVNSGKLNMTLVGIYYLVEAVLFLLIALLLIKFDMIMVSNWRPAVHSRISTFKVTRQLDVDYWRVQESQLYLEQEFEIQNQKFIQEKNFTKQQQKKTQKTFANMHNMSNNEPLNQQLSLYGNQNKQEFGQQEYQQQSYGIQGGGGVNVSDFNYGSGQKKMY